MAVFTSDGLIGRVTRVNQFSSQVDLLSTNKSWKTISQYSTSF